MISLLWVYFYFADLPVVLFSFVAYFVGTRFMLCLSTVGSIVNNAKSDLDEICNKIVAEILIFIRRKREHMGKGIFTQIVDIQVTNLIKSGDIKGI